MRSAILNGSHSSGAAAEGNDELGEVCDGVPAALTHTPKQNSFKNDGRDVGSKGTHGATPTITQCEGGRELTEEQTTTQRRATPAWYQTTL